MNPQLQSALAEILKLLTDAAKVAGTMGKEQLPLLVQEILKWGMISAAFWTGFGLLLLAGGIGLVRASLYGRGDESTGVGGLLMITAGLFAIGWNTYNLLYIYTAPRLYLLDQIKDLIK